jgi:amidohydrolase
VIPSHASITGTLRTFTESDTKSARARLDALMAEFSETTGCTFKLTPVGSAPAVVNDVATTDLVRAVAKEVVGADAVLEMPPVSPSDDVSEFLNRIPGTYFFVSAGRPDGSSGMHHSPEFSIDEGCLPIAASVLAASAVEAATPDH